MTDQVAVACKLPNGLHLDMVDKDGERVRHTLNGNATSRQPGQFEPDNPGGYAITMVDKAHWDAWSKKFAKTDMLRKGLIFATTSPLDTKAEAKGRGNVKGVSEPIPQPPKDNDGRDSMRKVDTGQALSGISSAAPGG